MTVIHNQNNVMKDFFAPLISLATIFVLIAGFFFGHSVIAADTDTISATVSATSLSLSVSSGSITFGSVALNTATSTVGSTYGQTVTNDGSSMTLNVKSSNATGGTTWALGTSAGSDQFKLETSTTTGSTWSTFQATDTYLTASSTVAAAATQLLHFRFTTPSDSTDFVQKTLTVTVQASTP